MKSNYCKCGNKICFYSIRCRPCSYKFRSGENHHMYGKHHSKESRIKISKKKKGVKLSIITRKRMSISRTLEKHPQWNGGQLIDKDGYKRILMPSHPNCPKTGYILEHRIIAEKYLGRLLQRTEDVHHIDGDRLNNSIFNLMVFSGRSSHRRYEEGKKINTNDIIFDGRNYDKSKL